MAKKQAKAAMKQSKLKENDAPSASALIDARIRELSDDWRGETLARAREVIQQAVPDIVEEWKWDVPVWSSAGGGIICTGEVYKSAVKLTFAKGAALPDPSGIFNSSLEGKTRRAIDFREGDAVPVKALSALARAADANNKVPKAEKSR